MSQDQHTLHYAAVHPISRLVVLWRRLLELYGAIFGVFLGCHFDGLICAKRYQIQGLKTTAKRHHVQQPGLPTFARFCLRRHDVSGTLTGR